MTVFPSAKLPNLSILYATGSDRLNKVCWYRVYFNKTPCSVVDTGPSTATETVDNYGTLDSRASHYESIDDPEPTK